MSDLLKAPPSDGAAWQPPAVTVPPLGRTVLAGVAALAVGLGLWSGARYLASSEPVPPFGAALTLFAPVEGWDEPPAAPPESPETVPAPTKAPPPGDASADAATPDPQAADSPADGTPAAPEAPAKAPPEPARPFDIGALYKTFSDEDLAAAEAALAPYAAGRLPLRLVWQLDLPPAPDAPFYALGRAYALALVPDETADAVLPGVVADGPAGADVYVGGPDAPAALLGRYDLATDLAGLRVARLAPSARALEGLVLVRRSAAARVGLADTPDGRNMQVLPLGDPADLEAACRAALPLWTERGLSYRPVDRTVPAWPAGAIGVAALGLILAGGAALAWAACAVAVRRAPRTTVGGWLHTALALLVHHRRALAAVVLALVVAAVIGAATLGPGVQRFMAAFTAGGRVPELTRVGLAGARPGLEPLASKLLGTAVGDVGVRGVVLISIPSLVPGLGLVSAAGQHALWGGALAPVTPTGLARLPLRAVPAAAGLLGYAALALGGWLALVGLARPAALGRARRRDGYAEGLERLYRLIPAAVVLLVAAALIETLFTAAVGWSG